MKITIKIYKTSNNFHPNIKRQILLTIKEVYFAGKRMKATSKKKEIKYTKKTKALKKTNTLVTSVMLSPHVFSRNKAGVDGKVNARKGGAWRFFECSCNGCVFAASDVIG